jgi:anaerobic selenocysteine-containing dehydrogenase
VFWSLAKRLGKTITYNRRRPLDMENPPTTDDLLEILLEGAPHTLAELKAKPHGAHATIEQEFVLPADDDADGRFDPMPADVAGELQRFIAEDSGPGRWHRDGRSFTHLLASRRMRDLFNSNGRFVETVRARTPFNPAYLHPSEFPALGIRPGDKIEIESAHGRVVAVAQEDTALRPGVVSLAHGWATRPTPTLPPKRLERR